MTALETAERNFSKALHITVDRDGAASIGATLPASTRRNVIYVAVRDDGIALKVGITKGRLIDRWRGIVATINGKRKRRNELQDQARWLRVMRGHALQVWCKEPSQLTIRLGEQEARTVWSPYAEEAYWDSIFRPCVGIELARRE